VGNFLKKFQKPKPLVSPLDEDLRPTWENQEKPTGYSSSSAALGEGQSESATEVNSADDYYEMAHEEQSEREWQTAVSNLPRGKPAHDQTVKPLVNAKGKPVFLWTNVPDNEYERAYRAQNTRVSPLIEDGDGRIPQTVGMEFIDKLRGTQHEYAWALDPNRVQKHAIQRYAGMYGQVTDPYPQSGISGELHPLTTNERSVP
jgi:hypothetical protein